MLFLNLLRFYLWSDEYNENKCWLKQIMSLPTRQWWNIICTCVWLGYPFTHHEKSYYLSSISDNPSLLSVLKSSKSYLSLTLPSTNQRNFFTDKKQIHVLCDTIKIVYFIKKVKCLNKFLHILQYQKKIITEIHLTEI